MSQATLLHDDERVGADATAVTPISVSFGDRNLFDWLSTASAADLDGLSFGVIAMALDGVVEHYNIAEGKLAGLTPSRVVGRNFFDAVAPCTNNFMVAERFLTERELDVVIDYVFTLRMSPQKVRLRMLKRDGSMRMYLAVERRS